MPRRWAAARLRSRFAPSPRSLLVGLAIAALGVGGYLFARESSAFAIRAVEVTGAPAPVAAQVRHALAPLVGTSLVGLDSGRVLARVDALPTVVRARYDRAFPHTLHVTVVPERPVAVVRRGKQAWIASARGRLIEQVARHSRPGLPRIWVPSATALEAGAFLAPDQGGDAARALSFASRFPPHIHSAATVAGSIVFRLRSGIELRLGEPAQMRLKLAVANLALGQLPAGSTYLDVGLPGRPVAGNDTVQTAPAQTVTAAAAQAPTQTSTPSTTTPTTTNPQVSTGG